VPGPGNLASVDGLPRGGQHVDHIYQKYKNFDEGDVATYIPELAKANPEHFGICLVTVDGRVVHAGKWEQEFTIQLICTPFAFQMALEQFGRDDTLKRVGVEPSGEAFNSIELDPKTMRPFNLMFNAGPSRFLPSSNPNPPISEFSNSPIVCRWPPAGHYGLIKQISRRRA
jgi:Glutaminase